MTAKTSLVGRLRRARAAMPEPSAPPLPETKAKATLPPSRQGLVNLNVWCDPVLRTHLRRIALDRGTTLNALVLHYIEKGLQNDGETQR